MKPDRIARFWQLMQEGYALVQKGRLKTALRNFEKALTVANTDKDRRLADKAMANRSMVLLEMGEFAKASTGLREIILRSRDQETSCGAAYNLAISLRRQGNYQKACFYARIAGEKARVLKDPTWTARCYNLKGNLHLMQSRFDAALREYRKSLAIRRREKEPNKFAMGILRDNIGYCLLLLGRYRQGIREILAAKQLAEDVGNTRCICECAHDLAFGYMQVRELEEAQKYGKQALSLARRIRARELVKNCYYLLGEICHLAGDASCRDHYFYELQRMHPNLPFLRDFLCTFDVSKIIALRFPQ